MNEIKQSPNWENALLLEQGTIIKPRKVYTEGFPKKEKQRCNLVLSNGERMQGIVVNNPKKGIVWKTKYSFKYESAVAGWQTTEDAPEFF